MQFRIQFLCLLLFSLFIITLNGYAANDVTIKGYAPDYAKMGLVLNKRTNPISRNKTEVASFQVDSTGNFITTFSLTSPIKATIDLGKFQGYFFIEPGKTYEIILPKYTPKSDAERLNPFFQAENIIIGIQNEEGILLNSMIRDFEEAFDYQFSKNIMNIFHRENSSTADSLINLLNQSFPSSDNEIFDQYKHYKYSLLYDASFKHRKSIVLKKFFYNQPYNINDPAFTEAFNQIYSNFLTNYMRRKKGKEVKKALISHDFDSISIALSHDTLYANQKFRELVILKGLYDGFYNDKFSQNTVIDILGNIDSTQVTATTKVIAEQLYTQMNLLRVGTKAPPFELYQLNGKIKDLSDFKGKFVYLNFCNTQNYSCKKDMQVLSQLAHDLKRELSIVTILTDQDLDSAKEFVQKNKYRWTILHYENMQQVMLDYNIKVLPSYFLINPEGNISLSPAPSPEEGFLFQFNDVKKEFDYQKLRSKPQKTKSIYDF